MKTKKLPLIAIKYIALFLLSTTSYSQVGIGTLTPDESAMLHMESTSKGMLAPRMSTAQRQAIANPVNGLLVYDITENAFYFYKANAWTKMEASMGTRTNYKLIKSAADLSAELTAGGGSKYLLNTNTYYEINGTIALTKYIDLNNAYVSGLDANEDVLSSNGVVFKGSTGGGIRNITLRGTKAFEIAGPGPTSATSLLVQNTIIDGMTTSVGTISGLGLYFGNIIQFLNNPNGITYSNIGNLLLNNQAWFNTNNGTFETFTGNFGLIQKVSGFSSVNGSAVGLDVSSNPIVSTGILQGTVFTGSTTASSGFVKGYTTGAYTGYNFNNIWSVSSPGIPRENDDVAIGNLYYDEDSTVGAVFINSIPIRLPVNTKSTSLFRTAEGTGINSENRIVYKGETRRPLKIFAAMSFTATSGTRFAFSIYKNGAKITGTEAIVDVTDINKRHAVTVIGTVNVVKNDYIEIYVRNTNTGTEQILITSYNLIVN